MTVRSDRFARLLPSLRAGDSGAAIAVCAFFQTELTQAARTIPGYDTKEVQRELCDQLLSALCDALDAPPNFPESNAIVATL